MIIPACVILLRCSLVLVCLSRFPQAAEPLAFEPPITEISAQNRLLLQQAEQLYRSDVPGEAAEVLAALLTRLVGPEGDAVNEVVQVGGVQKAGTLRVRRFLSVPRWVGDRLAHVVAMSQVDHSEHDTASQEALRQQMDAPQLSVQKANAVRFASTVAAWQHHLLEADLYLEKGWTLQALASLQRIDGRMQFSPRTVVDLVGAESAETLTTSSGFAWTLVPLASPLPEVAARVDAELAALLQSLESRSEGLSLAVLRRLAIASRLTPSLIEPARVSDLLVRVQEVCGEDMWVQLSGLSTSHSSGRVGQPATDGNKQPVKVAAERWDTSWPSWNVQLPRHTSTSDQTPASRPRVGEVESGSLPYQPAIWGKLVFLNEMNRLSVFELASGRRWPGEEPLAESGLEPMQLIERDLGVVGVPRGEVQIYDDCLYARIGSAITGRAPNSNALPGSKLVGIDLVGTRSNGRVVSLPGFPLSVPSDDFPDGQFEGPPLASGDLLFVPIAQRSNIGLRRSVVAFDRWSGELVWRSAPLGTGTVAGTEQSHHVAHQCLTLAGGYLYYLTNLGAVVCLDPSDGRIEWLSQYSRPDIQRQVEETPNRYLYRSSNPCLVHGGLVYCAPSDCGELFALDATSGNLVWSSVSTDVPDAIFILGIAGDSLIVSGDRLVWINRHTGQIQARFPGSTTPGISNSLPEPRGLGRGTLHDGYVYYPVAGEILVFEAMAADGASRRGIPVPSIADRIEMDSRGAVGGNLVVHDGKLIYASPSRLMLFK